MGIWSNIKKLFAPFSDPEINAVERALLRTIEKNANIDKEIDKVYGLFMKSFLYAWNNVKGDVESNTGDASPDEIQKVLKKSGYWKSAIFAEFAGFTMSMLRYRPEKVLNHFKFLAEWLLIIQKDHQYHEFYKALSRRFYEWIKYAEQHPEIKNGKEKEFQTIKGIILK